MIYPNMALEMLLNLPLNVGPSFCLAIWLICSFIISFNTPFPLSVRESNTCCREARPKQILLLSLRMTHLIENNEYHEQFNVAHRGSSIS